MSEASSLTPEALRVLFSLEVKRIENILEAGFRRIDEQMRLRDEFSNQTHVAEAKRIDAILAQSAANVSTANERAQDQAQVLATQLVSTAEKAREQVVDATAAQAEQWALLTSRMESRIVALEQAQFEHRGKSGGMRDMWGWVAGAVGLIFAALAFFREKNP